MDMIKKLKRINKKINAYRNEELPMIIIKIFTIIIIINIIELIIKKQYYNATKIYLLITISFYIGNIIAYHMKKLESPITYWKTIMWPISVFNKKTYRRMFK